MIGFEDAEAIKQLKARYFRHVDEQDWDAVERLFWPDAEIDASTAASGGVGDFMASLRGLAEGVMTFHAGHMPELEAGPDGAVLGRWAMTFYMQWPGPDGPQAIHGFRRYEDVYRKAGGEWRIAAMRIEALDADPLRATPATAAPPR